MGQARRAVGVITERERFCPCRDPLLLCPEEILPRRRIFRAKKDFPRGEACQEQEFRTDNLPLLLLLARPLEQVKLHFPPGARLEAERVHSD